MLMLMLLLVLLLPVEWQQSMKHKILYPTVSAILTLCLQPF
jgi:hypothetical protein